MWRSGLVGSMEAATSGREGGVSLVLRLLVAAAPVAPPVEGAGPHAWSPAARRRPSLPGSPPPVWGWEREGGVGGERREGEVKEDDMWGPQLGS
jgi:hypothetical protein